MPFTARIYLLQADPRGERRDGLEPQHLLDGARHQAGIVGQQLPLARALGEEADRVRELARGRVDAPGQQVHHELYALRGGQPPARLPFFAGRQQFADQVVAGSGPPGLEQTGYVLLGVGDGPLDVIPAGLERPDIELPLYPGGPGVQPPGIPVRRPEHGRDRQRRVEPGHRGHEVATAVGGDPGPQVLKEAPHHRAPAIGRPRRERGAHQRPQAPVLLPGEVQDVGVDVLGQRAAGHAEELGDLAAGERGLP